jgi:hypothetical protein
MDQRGQGAAVGVLVLFAILFGIYLIYSTFHVPVTTIVSAMDNVDDDNTVPDGITTNLNLGWEIWPIILIILTVLIVVAYAFRRESEHAYY